MLDQQLFNIMFAIAGALGGWWMKAIWEAVKELEKSDRGIRDDMSDIKLLVAGQYVRQEDFDKLSGAIFKKLDRIEDKLDHKVDKP